MFTQKSQILNVNVLANSSDAVLHAWIFVERKTQLWLVDLVDVLGEELAVQFATQKVVGLHHQKI